MGEKTDAEIYQANGIEINERGKAKYNQKTMETGVSGIYLIGDGAGGAATIVEAIRDAQLAAEAILAEAVVKDTEVQETEESCFEKKGILARGARKKQKKERCLVCNKICEKLCRCMSKQSNISIKVPGMAMNQIIHVDYMCNECGNCKSFCPYA